MGNLIELRQRRADLIGQAETLLNKAKTENRDLTAEELTQYDGLMAQIKTLKTEIEKLERQVQREDELRVLKTELGTSQGVTVAAKDLTPGNPPAQPKQWYRSLGEQLIAVVQAATPGSTVDSRLLEIRAASGLTSAVPSDGGFVVQKEFVAEMLKNTYDVGALAAKCRHLPVGANADGIKINGIEETSRAAGSRWGGVRAYWKKDAGTVASSKPKFREIAIDLQDLMAVCYATNNLLRDASLLEAVIRQAFAEEMAFTLDEAIFRGSGVGEPLGVLNSNALVTVAKEAVQAAKTVETENIVKMWARMWARSRRNAIWAINQDIEPELHTMSLAVGGGGTAVYMPAGGLSGLPYSTLYGRPVVPIEQAATLGTKGDIVLMDLSQYLLIDKGGVEAAQSIHVQFLYQETTFLFTYRVNGMPAWSSVLTPAQGDNTLSPFVALAVRAA